MRIIITSNGIQTIQEIDDMRKSRTTSYGRSFRRSFTIEKPKNACNQLGKTFYKSKPHAYAHNHRSLFKVDEDYIKDENSFRRKLINSNQVQVKINKLNFPKQISDNYEKDKLQRQNIIEDKILGDEWVELKSKHKNGEKLSLGEILKTSKIYGLKKNLIEQQRMRDKLSTIDEQKFRSSYQKFTELEKLDHILNYKKILPGNVNLIKYLNEKKDIKKFVLREIVEATQESLFKKNKICQNMLTIDKEYRMLTDMVNTKIKNKKLAEKNVFDSSLKKMESNINDWNTIFNKYNQKVNKMQKYREPFDDIKSYWKKHNIDVIAREKLKTREQILSQNTE